MYTMNFMIGLTGFGAAMSQSPFNNNGATGVVGAACVGLVTVVGAGLVAQKCLTELTAMEQKKESDNVIRKAKLGSLALTALSGYGSYHFSEKLTSTYIEKYTAPEKAAHATAIEFQSNFSNNQNMYTHTRSSPTLAV